MGDFKIPAGCNVGTIYHDNIFLDGQKKAQECADALTKATGKPHELTLICENISDGLPARVMICYYKVIKGDSQK